MTHDGAKRDPKRHPAAERVERDRRIAEAVLAGERIGDIAEREGVSRSTVKRAARSYAPTLRSLAEREETLKAVEDVDVQYLLALGLDSIAMVLKIGRQELVEAKTTGEQVKVMRAIVHAHTSLVTNCLRLGLVANAEDTILRAKVSETLRELGVTLAQAATAEGVDLETVERMLRRTEDGAAAVVERAKASPWIAAGGNGHAA